MKQSPHGRASKRSQTETVQDNAPIKYQKRDETGFTLIELVITMVVIGIIILGISNFIQIGTQGYSDTVDRQRLQTQARFVVEKVTREIRHAVPNSFDSFTDSGNKCLSFYPIKYAGFYKSLPTESDRKLEFRVVSSDTVMSGNLDGNRLVIYPQHNADLEDSHKSIELAGVTGNSDLFTQPLDSAGYGDFIDNNVAFVGSRLYIYNPDGQVTYCLVGNQIQRGINGMDFIQVGEDINFNASSVDITGAVGIVGNGSVNINLLFEQDGEQSRYASDIEVLNAP